MQLFTGQNNVAKSQEVPVPADITLLYVHLVFVRMPAHPCSKGVKV